MSFLDHFRSKPPSDSALAERLADLVVKRLTDRTNRIRAEDAICGTAAIVGERCIDASGDYSLRDHDIAPGTRVFSDRANQLLCGDTADVGFEGIPADSIFGRLKAGVKASSYPKETFPDVASVFRGYAAGIGKPEDWGKVPVTVPPDNRPGVLPLQFAYETRSQVDAILKSVVEDKSRCLWIATNGLAAMLNKVAGVIAPDVALRLAFEISNGMAKTAPMTEKAMRAVRKPIAG
jgi:hypothetical protein